MNNLQVKTIKLEPATIVFNHKEIEKELDATLERYDNLIFTEENTTDLRNTIAEIRKGQNALNRYRIDTKKELNEPANEFDTTVKGLDEKFKNVLNPLLEQQSEFEETRKAEKLAKVQEILDQVIEEFELDHNRADELQIIDSYLTKSKSIKSIAEELTTQAAHLKLQQDKEKADKSVIETTVKLSNSENDLSLSVEAYIRLLDFQDVEKVKEQIGNDSKKEIVAREQAVKKELERIEREKEQEKLKEIEVAVTEKVKQKEQSDKLKESFEEVEKVVNNEPTINDLPFPNPFDNEPIFEEIANPFAKDFNDNQERLYEETIDITVTSNQFDKLVEFMDQQGINWNRSELMQHE